MKTNHQRGFKDDHSRRNPGTQHGFHVADIDGSFHYMGYPGLDHAKGHRGAAHAKKGAKKFAHSRRRRSDRDILNRILTELPV